MAAAFDSWTVLPHDPLQKLAENLWHVEGAMPNPTVRRQMTLARMRDGRVVVHNAIALEEDLMKELEAWGEPAFLVVPNGFHRQDAKIWKQRYPKMKVLAPRGSKSRIAKVVAVEGELTELPADDDVKLEYLDGCKAREGALVVRSERGSSVVFTDAVMNVPKGKGFLGFFLGPTGIPSVPRVARWILISDKRAFRSHLDRLADTENLQRIIVGHGAMLTESPSQTLHTVAAALG